jgi:hypothetical protein
VIAAPIFARWTNLGGRETQESYAPGLRLNSAIQRGGSRCGSKPCGRGARKRDLHMKVGSVGAVLRCCDAWPVFGGPRGRALNDERVTTGREDGRLHRGSEALKGEPHERIRHEIGPVGDRADESIKGLRKPEGAGGSGQVKPRSTTAAARRRETL